MIAAQIFLAVLLLMLLVVRPMTPDQTKLALVAAGIPPWAPPFAWISWGLAFLATLATFAASVGMFR